MTGAAADVPVEGVSEQPRRRRSRAAEYVVTVEGTPAEIADQVAELARCWANDRTGDEPVAGVIAFGLPDTRARSVSRFIGQTINNARLDILPELLANWPTSSLGAISAQELRSRAEHLATVGRGELQMVLRKIAGGDDGEINLRRLGQWLGYAKGYAIKGRRLEQSRLLHGVRLWDVVS